VKHVRNAYETRVRLVFNVRGTRVKRFVLGMRSVVKRMKNACGKCVERLWNASETFHTCSTCVDKRVPHMFQSRSTCIPPAFHRCFTPVPHAFQMCFTCVPPMLYMRYICIPNMFNTRSTCVPHLVTFHMHVKRD
jgi:hypothetical protein